MNLIWIKRRRRRQQQHDWLRLISSSSSAAAARLFFSTSSPSLTSHRIATFLSLALFWLFLEKSRPIAKTSLQELEETLMKASILVRSLRIVPAAIFRRWVETAMIQVARCFSRKGGRPWLAYVCQMRFVEADWSEQGKVRIVFRQFETSQTSRFFSIDESFPINSRWWTRVFAIQLMSNCFTEEEKSSVKRSVDTFFSTKVT